MKKNEIENITFKQFMLTFNFAHRYDEINADTIIIKILLPQKDYCNRNDWIEFGIYNYDSTYDFLERLEKVFSPEILNSYVDGITTDDYFGIVSISLTYNKYIEFG